jgi:NADH-quinone oxidoreductase subunit N
MSMSFQVPDFTPALPEAFLLGMLCAILILDLFLSDRSRIVTYAIAQLTLLGAMFLTLSSMSAETVLTFSGTYIRDGMADILKLAIYASTFVTFLYAKDYLRDRGIFKGEFYTLGLFGTLGMSILVSAHNFLTIYLGLELLSLSLYAMVVIQRDSSIASEAAMKYFVLGAIASGMLLYGMSIIYGITGTLDLAGMTANITVQTPGILLSFGLVFIIVGIAFKLGAVPFHMWVPDVYQGAPTAVTLFIGSAPKIAAFAMLMRLLVDGLYDLHPQWEGILIILAVLSMAIGNLLAIAQTNIKRMLAYSTISHVGFLILGVLTGTQSGFAASMFYTLAYVIMALAGFGIVMLLSRKGFEAENLDDFKGLNERSPWYAFLMLSVMFSMAGVPPFLGFWAKLVVLEQVIAANMVWLAIVGVVFSVIGAFYYLRIVKLMYFDKPADDSPALTASFDTRLMVSLNSLLILFMGIFPGSLLGLCQAAFPG